MNCQRVSELWDIYIAGALSIKEREEIASHLALCPRCAAFSDLSKIFKGFEVKHPPAGIFEGVLEKIENKEGGVMQQLFNLKRLALAASTLIIMLSLAGTLSIITSREAAKKDVNRHLFKIANYLNSHQSWVEPGGIF